MSQYFPKPFRSGRNINVTVDLSKLSTLKTEVDKLDTDKSKTVSVDLSKLTNVEKNDGVKKAVCDKLVNKVNGIDTSEFVLKTKYDTHKLELESKIPSITNLVKKTLQY